MPLHDQIETPQVLTLDDLGRLLGIHKDTLSRRRGQIERGELPADYMPPDAAPPGCHPRYLLVEVLAWMRTWARRRAAAAAAPEGVSRG